jgi:hypothetical protein
VADVVLDLAAGAMPELGRQAAGRPFVVGRLAGRSVRVATLVGRPCAACARMESGAPSALPLDAPLHLVLGALAASEVLQALWAPPGQSLLQQLDPGGRPEVRPLEGAGCPACGGTA